MKNYKTFFGETIDLDALSPEAKQIYAVVKECYDKYINKSPEEQGSEFYNTEWRRLQDAYFGEIKRLRAGQGGGRLVLKDEDVLRKLYDDLEVRFCLKKQEQRTAKERDGKKNK